MDLEENSQILMTSQFDNDIDLICSHWSKCQEEVRNFTISKLEARVSEGSRAVFRWASSGGSCPSSQGDACFILGEDVFCCFSIKFGGVFKKMYGVFIANLGALAAIFEAPLSILAQIWGRCFYLGAPCPLPFRENMSLEGRGSLVGKSKAREGAWVGQVRGQGRGT